MERWAKVLLGTVFGSLAAIVFFLIFEKAVQWVRRRRERGRESAIGLGVQVKLRAAEGAARGEEAERLVYEEFDTEQHEVLGIALQAGQVAVGISCFFSDREVEYYWERVPECCLREGAAQEQRNLMAAVSLWSAKWTMAEAVNFLVSSGELVRALSSGSAAAWRQVARWEERHQYSFYPQWTDNYVCGDVAAEDLWEEVVAAAKRLVNSSEAEVDDCWEDLPVAHWRRRRVRVATEHFHCVPHPGEVTPDLTPAPSDAEVSVATDLVTL